MGDEDGLDQQTRDPPRSHIGGRGRPVLTLTILHHPDIARTGERAALGPETRLSRLEPLFSAGGQARPLADPFISRSPLAIERRSSGVVISRESAAKLSVDGVPVETSVKVDPAKGTVLELGGRVALLLHDVPDFQPAPDPLGMIGEAKEMHAIRWDILRVARSDLPVLIRGETGTGKEHVARALHQQGLRPEGPFVAVNMAAIQPALAASTLFGHAKGAFTGAEADRVGLFARADGGTLFLDEIGEAPVEVQAMLLRILETGRFEPVGSAEEQAVSVRLLTATDADLGGLVADSSFRPALLHRLSGYEIFIPPLRERREDIGRLAAHFYQAEQSRLAELDPERIAPERDEWLPASVMAFLARQDWPGNVRQLGNVVRRLVLMADLPPERMLEQLQRSLTLDEPSQEPDARTSPRRPQDVTEQEVFDAMEATGWRLEKAAERLGISRPSLYRLIQAHPELRTAKDLTEGELLEAHRRTNGDADRMSDLLRVSRSGIRQRLRQLQID